MLATRSKKMFYSKFPIYTYIVSTVRENEKIIIAAWINKQCTEARNLHPFLRGDQEGSRTLLCQELGATCSRANLVTFPCNPIFPEQFHIQAPLLDYHLEPLVEQKDRYECWGPDHSRRLCSLFACHPSGSFVWAEGQP